MMSNNNFSPLASWLNPAQYDIAVILPSRKRNEMLESSLLSLVKNAANPDRIQFLLGFDDDDRESLNYFKDTVGPQLENYGSKWLAAEFPRYGYGRLHEYINQLTEYSNANWIFFWNDDAQMLSQDWDLRISEHNGEFKCLRIPTHNEHPYAIFPIVPREWYMLFGYLSLHQLNDAWISQISYIVGIMENISVDVIHDRHDLTGNNKDEVYEQRICFEANPQDARDFNHQTARTRRYKDAIRIAWYLQERNEDISWFKNVLAGTQDPWEIMMSPEFDPNKQISYISPTGQRSSTPVNLNKP